LLNPYNQLGGKLVKDNRTADEVMKDIDETLEEMGPLPDNTDENRRRVEALEKSLVEIMRVINKSK